MRTLYLPCLLLIFAALACAEVDPVTTTVTARGEAAIVNGDLPAAREEALVDAQRNALEQVLGVHIRSQSAVQDFALADDAVLTMIEGYVRSSKILSETRQDSFLTLEVQCEVAKELTEEDVGKLVRNFGCVLLMTTEIDSQEVNDNRINQALSTELVKAGFDVMDTSRFYIPKDAFTALAMALSPDSVAARLVGFHAFSNVVIAGKAELQQREKKQVTGFAGVVGVYAYTCRLEARAMETGTGLIIAQHTAPLEGVMGTGDTPQKAVSDALSRAKGEFVNDLVAQLTRYGGKKSRPITIEVGGIPDLETFQKVKDLLNNVRFRDSQVSDLGFQAGQISTFRFDYSENLNLIAIKLERTPGLTVTGRTGNRVVCRYSTPE